MDRPQRSLKRKRSSFEESSCSEEPPCPEESLVELLCVDSNSSRNGIIVDERRIVVNAHSIDKNTHEVKLKKPYSDDEYAARVLAIGTDCNLALLTVDDDEFWNDVYPVDFGPLPALGDDVTIVGYPKGDCAISATSGLASSLSMRSYIQGYQELLCLMINAMADLQHFSGPAFNRQGECVGISLHLLKDEYSDRNAYFIPSYVIRHFVNDYQRSKKYTGFPVLELKWQNTMDEGMDEGIRVLELDPTFPASLYLKPYDVILKIDNFHISSNGNVFSPRGEPFSFSYLITQKYTGDTVAIKVLRDSEVHTFHIKLRRHKSPTSREMLELPQSYYIVGGLVFTSVYADSGERLDSPPYTRYNQIVVIYQVLEAEINAGYKDITNIRVLKLNGEPIRNLKGLVNLVDTCNERLLRFDLENGKFIIFKTETAKAATLDILVKHNIPSALSDDLKS